MSSHALAVVPSRFSRAYEPIIARVRPHLNELEQLATQPALTHPQIQRVGKLLNRIANQVFELSRKAVRSFEKNARPPNKNPSPFEDEFGHPAPEWQGHPIKKHQDPQTILRCVQNTFAQNYVFGAVRGVTVGSIIAPSHIAPTVKIAGRTFVLDRWLFGRKTAPTLKEYFHELRRGLSEPLPWSPLSIVRVAPSDSTVPPVFTRQIVYTGGTKGAEAMAHFNQGLTLAENQRPLEAMDSLRTSASILPIGDTYYAMADVILDYPKKRLAAMMREKKLDRRQFERHHHGDWGGPRQALRLLAKANQLAPSDPETFNLMGLAYDQLAQPVKATLFFKKALALARKKHFPAADQQRFLKNIAEIETRQKQKQALHRPPINRKAPAVPIKATSTKTARIPRSGKYR